MSALSNSRAALEAPPVDRNRMAFLDREIAAGRGSAKIGGDLPPRIFWVLKRLCEESGEVSMAELLGPSKAHAALRVRKKAIRELTDCGFSTPEIGRFMRRDASTVQNALRPRKQPKRDQPHELAPEEVWARLGRRLRVW